VNDAFAALQRLRSNKVAAVAGVLPAAAPPSLPLLAGDALGRRAEAAKAVVNESRRILALDTWDREAMLKQAEPGGPLDYTPQLRTAAGTMQIKPIQNLALHWIKEKKGLVGPLAVGAGKTLISLLAPVVMGAQRPILLVPPTMQIPVRREFEALQKHFRLPQSLLIIPYSQLSVAKSTALLEQVKPDLIVADECFPYETRVVTDVGSVSIGDIVEKGIGESALSYDGEEGTFTWRPIVRRLRKNRTTGMVTVVHEYGTFRCTEEHKIWTANRGYVEARRLTSSDTLATVPDLRHPPYTVSPTESYLREEVVSSCLLYSEDGCGKEALLDQGAKGVRGLREHLSSGRVRKNSRETGDLFPHLHGKESLSESAGEGSVAEGVLPETAFGGMCRVQHLLSDCAKGQKHGEVLFSVVRLEEEQPTPLSSRRQGESQRNPEFGGFCSGSERKSETAAGGPAGNAKLSCVRKGVSSSSKQPEKHMFCGVRKGGDISKTYGCEAKKSSGHGGEDAAEQPGEAPGGSGENVGHDAGKDFPFSRREREADPAAGGPVSRAGRGSDGVSYPNGSCEGSVSDTSSLLQGGCCTAGAQGCCGGGRQKPQLSEVAVPRPSEGERPRVSRVVCVSVLEPGSGHLAGSGGSSGDGVVYDLEVADTHNYLADGVVVSNCHSIRSPNTARTKRVLRYFRQFPTTRFVALSGTLTAKSLRDYAHLCELALRGGSPLPTEEADLLAWANCIDADSTPQDRDWSLFAQFCDLRHIDDEVRRRDDARERFRERFVTTPGVVATTEASVQCSLNFIERSLHTPPVVQDALRELHRTGCRPDGEVMEEALAVWRLGMQMSQGFYLRWVWPNGVVDFEWLEARAEWHRQVRYVLQQNITGLDSPFLVWQGVARGTITDPAVIRAWAAWDAVRHRPPPPTETVWLDDFLVRDAVAWLREHPKGLLWHNDLAVEAALRAAGIPTYGRGEVPPLDGSVGGMALSVRVHGTGLNLQHPHHENLLLSFSSSGKTMEQLIGRTHRQGQPADEVNLFYYRHTTDAQAAVLDARRNATYIEDTQGSPQKLCYGTWV
jgi:hypothetical protein